MSNLKVLIDGVWCSSCKQAKESTAFHKDSTATRGLAYYCKKCANEKGRQWNANATPEQLEKKNSRVKIKNKENKTWAIELMGGKCHDCHNTFHSSVYDFHHVDMTTKDKNPSYYLKGDKEKAIKELSKCILLCANCHRLRHFGEQPCPI